ncbi:MAG: RT0821/Lpp0805 family surface protein [Rhizobiaceae bacterium]|nr:RT0821/Lpp0805 family surface protein [Rhizobiaceae bacterium]
MNRFPGIACVVFAALLQGCASTGNVSDGGERFPSESVITALGGGLIGGSIGRDLSSRDRRKALEAEYKALEYGQGGQVITWQSSLGSSRGEVVAAQPYRVGSQDCRQYVHTLYTGDASQTARGTACRNPDGSWSLLN